MVYIVLRHPSSSGRGPRCMPLCQGGAAASESHPTHGISAHRRYRVCLTVLRRHDLTQFPVHTAVIPTQLRYVRQPPQTSSSESPSSPQQPLWGSLSCCGEPFRGIRVRVSLFPVDPSPLVSRLREGKSRARLRIGGFLLSTVCGLIALVYR